MDTSESTVVQPQTDTATDTTKVEGTTTEDTQSTREEPAETPEAKVARLDRELRRAKKQAGIEDEKPKTKAKQSDDISLDYGKKAYLRAEGIDASEFDFVAEQMEESGITDLDRLVKNPYFQSILKDRRDKAAIEKATPSATRGATESPKSKAEYWVDKGEMPPNTPENQKLRREIVELRYERSKGVTGLPGSK